MSEQEQFAQLWDCTALSYGDAARTKLFHWLLPSRGRSCTIFVEGARTFVDGKISQVIASGQDVSSVSSLKRTWKKAEQMRNRQPS